MGSFWEEGTKMQKLFLLFIYFPFSSISFCHKIKRDEIPAISFIDFRCISPNFSTIHAWLSHQTVNYDASSYSYFSIYWRNYNIYRKIKARETIHQASVAKEKLPEKYGPFWFDQPIDHFSLNTTTFKHRYWANTDYYKEGGPVICK